MGLAPGVTRAASIIAQGYADSTEGFAFCLSEAGDLLSQWRAYAADGSGIAIGFDPDVLTRDFGRVSFGSQYFELLKVAYGEDSITGELETIAKTVFEGMAVHGDFVRVASGLSDDEARRRLADRSVNAAGVFVGGPRADELLSKLLGLMHPLHFRIYGVKPSPFHEEREWRLVRYQPRAPDRNVEFSADDDTIRPFVSCLISDEAKQAIRKVVLGPKHHSDANWVRAFLRSLGLDKVDVTRSAIESYR